MADEEDLASCIVINGNTGKKELGGEAYELSVRVDRVMITAQTAHGAYYGTQSLYQLLPPEVEHPAASKGIPWKIPCVEIMDRPRFPWRGMHLDVGRHFFPPAFVKRYLDVMAAYKLNTFHWHLTEDQGWRIEIKKYPRLTGIGSQRRETMGDCAPYGGYYTQDEVREVVEYARQRFIDLEIKKYPRLTGIGSQRRETMGDCAPYGGYYTQDEVREVVEYARQRFISV